MSASATGPLAALTRHLAALAEDAAARPAPCRTLTAAAVSGDVDLVRAFLDDGADIQERTIGFESPLAAAASAGHLAVVDLLLERGASLDQPDAMFPILHFPILHQRALMIEHLLRAGAPRDKHRRHLRLRAKERHWAAVDAMLEGGMDPAWLDPDHRAGLEAWRAENPDRLAAWRAAEAEADARRVAPSRRGRPLEPTARAAEEAAAVGLVQAHPELARASTASGTSLLVVAAQAGADELVRALLAAGADPDACGSGPSALMRAAERGDVEMLRLLLERAREDWDGRRTRPARSPS
jgi:ankyrin repeat protein